ncbi:pirin family protein [Chryseobacterium sp.]|uniref:pirin family protein n=1 Tax=Chryseobacterium sp. TaxID=1871047 RepID=UPI0026109200|nr:pirin family protein [Chryseobacterium sp.]
MDFNKKYNNNMQRNIKRTWKVILKEHNDKHTSGLVLPPENWKEFDPFLLMAEDKFKKNAFDFHPHRGMETVTYIINGELQHTDNKGGKGTLHSGDVQWMTAGNGIIHLEEPAGNTTVHSLQLWVNLPQDKKMTSPRYQDILSSDAPLRKEEGVIYRVFSGNSANVISPTKNHAPISMVEISIEAEHTAIQDLSSDSNGFIYVLEGTGIFGANLVVAEKGDVLLLDSPIQDSEKSEIVIKAENTLKVLFFAGKPLEEPIVAKGPFVMNTEDEIKQAYADFRSGKF